MSLDQLRSAIERQLAGAVDRAGVGPLDVLIARARGVRMDAQLWIGHLLGILEELDVTRPGFWSAVRLIVGRLELRAKPLAARIETLLLEYEGTLDPFEAYEGWRAFVGAGGYLAARRVRSLATIRANRPGLWLDLGAIAYRGDPAGLGRLLRDLVAEGLIKPRDLMSRLTPLQESLGQEYFLSEMREVIRHFPNPADATEFGRWLDAKVGTVLFSEARKSGERRGASAVEKLERLIAEASTFAFRDGPAPRSILRAVAA